MNSYSSPVIGEDTTWKSRYARPEDLDTTAVRFKQQWLVSIWHVCNQRLRESPVAKSAYRDSRDYSAGPPSLIVRRNRVEIGYGKRSR